MEKESKAICEGLSKRLHQSGVTELVVLCPNCYAFLKEHLDIPVVSIYQKLIELNLVQPLRKEYFPLYLPCPDRHSREMFESFIPLLQGQIEEIKGIQCCGLGGCAAACEPEISAGFGQKMKEQKLSNLYLLCFLCRNFSRAGCQEVRHLLVELLQTEEQPPKGVRSLLIEQNTNCCKQIYRSKERVLIDETKLNHQEGDGAAFKSADLSGSQRLPGKGRAGRIGFKSNQF